jgi:hypothetical protein
MTVNARHAKGVLIGDHGVQHNHYSGRAAVSWPHRVGVVPLLADHRVDRPADRHLAAAGVDTVVVCAGLGGVGKTQLAAALAHYRWNHGDVDLLVWVNATARTSIVARYAEAAADVTGVDHPDPEQGAARLLAWLAATARRWLVVLDDLIDPNAAAGLWPPVTPAGRTVVTTRRRDTALLAGRQLIDVDLFSPDEAARYLHGKLSHQPDRLDQADGLAADLGYLPLALAQAAAYITDQALTCAGYRRRLANRRLADLAPHALPDDHRATLAATWALSIDLADTLAPAGVARPVIELAALLDPNAIPTALFGAAAVTDHCTTRLARPVDRDDTHDALRLLHRLNLATIDQATNTLRVHGLVQRAVRETTPVGQGRPLAAAAADALLELWPDIERDSTHAHLLRANTTALHTTTGPLLWTDQDGGHPVLFQAGHSLITTGIVAAAVDYFTHLHTTATHHLGPDHPDTLATRANLAYCQGQVGDPAGAAATYEQLLTDVVPLFGQDHADTLAVRHNIAFWRGEAGDPAGAVMAFEQLLADRLRVLGPDHPDTLAARGNLAYWRGEAGDPAAATELEHLLADRLRVLGPDHPDTLATRATLAAWRGDAGDPAGAATAYQQVLTDMVRILGPDHPHTLVARGDIARLRVQAGDLAGATAAYEQLLTDMVRVLGPDHPFTLATRSNLVAWRGVIGGPASAAAALEQLLTDIVRVLGPDHPDILTTRENLAHWRGRAGDPTAATTELERLLADRLRVLGPDHPHTLTTRHEIAHWRKQARQSSGNEEPPPL